MLDYLIYVVVQGKKPMSLIVGAWSNKAGVMRSIKIILQRPLQKFYDTHIKIFENFSVRK